LTRYRYSTKYHTVDIKRPHERESQYGRTKEDTKRGKKESRKKQAKFNFHIVSRNVVEKYSYTIES
jgi:hypothetical protein